MDDLDAAIAVVTDPANLSAFGGNGYRACNRSSVEAALRRDGLGEGEAKRRGRDAVAHVGGRVERVAHTGGLAAGRRRRHHDEVWWVPTSALR